MPHFVELVAQAKLAIKSAKDLVALDLVRVEFLGKNGHLTSKILMLRNLSTEDRPTVGAIINKAKKEVQYALDARKKQLENEILNDRLLVEKIDISLPGRRVENTGSFHPVTRTIDRIEEFFTNLSFFVIFGSEIEDDYHNFDALNIPKDHPARDSHDTFWFDNKCLLRTHTSGVQIRVMKEKKPPIRIISSGRVYRNDYDQIHTPMFHQIEGLIVDENINFTNLKGTIFNFLNYFFEGKTRIRFRSSYFPFTEPSAEVDVMKKNGKWLEVLGCGMVHPNVLRNVGIDSELYSGFAFGIGVERLAMLRYGIIDIRAFFENDLRFLKKFR